jgi:hypothetical protein
VPRWVAGGVALLVAVIFIGVRLTKPPPIVHDPRAYDISTPKVSLEEALKRAHLVIPECLESNLRYALIDNGFGYYYDIYLKLDASVSCADTFLLANAMRDTLQAQQVGGVDAEKPISFRNSWMDGEPVHQMGWQLGTDQRYQEFGVGNEQMYNVTALLQHVPDISKVRMFVYAFHGG